MNASTQQQQKQAVATDALKYIESGMFLGVGTGSTVNLLLGIIAKS